MIDKLIILFSSPSRNLALSDSIAQRLEKLWDTTVHYIKTIYGISFSYTSTQDQPLFGPGQGSICGPGFYFLCYWTMVQSLDATIPKMRLLSVYKSVLAEVLGVSFADNMSLGVISDYPHPEFLSSNTFSNETQHVTQQLVELYQHWKKLLFTTGGTLNL